MIKFITSFLIRVVATFGAILLVMALCGLLAACLIGLQVILYRIGGVFTYLLPVVGLVSIWCYFRGGSEDQSSINKGVKNDKND